MLALRTEWTSLDGDRFDPSELVAPVERVGDFDHVVLALGVASIPIAA